MIYNDVRFTFMAIFDELPFQKGPSSGPMISISIVHFGNAWNDSLRRMHPSVGGQGLHREPIMNQFLGSLKVKFNSSNLTISMAYLIWKFSISLFGCHSNYPSSDFVVLLRLFRKKVHLSSLGNQSHIEVQEQAFVERLLLRSRLLPSQ